MKTYRIKEYIMPDGHRSYEVQRRSILGFWYNPDNVDANVTGFYGSLEKAQEAIKEKLTPVRTIYHYNQ